jgi:hypothetical protein
MAEAMAGVKRLMLRQFNSVDMFMLPAIHQHQPGESTVKKPQVS